MISSRYSANEKGLAEVHLSVVEFSLGGDYPVSGRVVVIHDASGNRAACGPLVSTAGEIVSLASYPGYSGAAEYLNVTGTLVVSENEEGFGVTITGTVGGLESNAQGGIHIHVG